ncbi:MAG: Rieske (2Fe-2S) protein [Thermomicrobiales bacterium]
MTATSNTQSSTCEKYVEVGPLEGMKSPTVVSGGRHGIAVFISDGEPYAVDNRCPHMGFPLDKGTVRDGILTCHWHHARFDLESGGTFDPFANDVQVYESKVEDGIVYVNIIPPTTDWKARWLGRLSDGLEQNLNLLSVKSVLALLESGVDPKEVVEVGAVFGSRYRDQGWRSGLTILSAMNNMLPHLKSDDQVLALYHGMVNVARDCAGQPPHFQLDELPTHDVPAERLKTWFRYFVEVRDRDGAERAILTAIHAGLDSTRIADMMAAAATDHFFLDGGHSFDFVNKACEMLDSIGWDNADRVLPSIIPSLTDATRSEELNSWRYPIDLVELVDEAFADIDEALDTPRDDDWFDGMQNLADVLLGDDPEASVTAVRDAIANGAPLTDLTLTLSYASALRIARFHTSNEFADWITVLHTFTYNNAVHQMMQRAPSTELIRGVFHGAMSIYLDRFLNMPSARLPENRNIEREPTGADDLLDKLLELTDIEQRVDESAIVVWRYLTQGHNPKPLIATLGHVLLREDGEFHSYQMLEAGTQLFNELRDFQPEAANRVMVAIARYLAAKAPTSRAMLQTAKTAIRLHRGDNIYESAEDNEAMAAAAD